MKKTFTLKELSFLYCKILENIGIMEHIDFTQVEQCLQYDSEYFEQKQKRHLEDLKNNKDYKDLIILRDKLENIKLIVNIEDN